MGNKKNINFEELTLLDQINITVKSLLGKFPMLNLNDIVNDVYIKITQSNPNHEFINFVHRYCYVNIATKQVIQQRYRHHKKHCQNNELYENLNNIIQIENNNNLEFNDEMNVVDNFIKTLTDIEKLILEFKMSNEDGNVVDYLDKHNISMGRQTASNHMNKIKIKYNKFFGTEYKVNDRYGRYSN